MAPDAAIYALRSARVASSPNELQGALAQQFGDMVPLTPKLVCLYTLRPISKRPEGTFVRLRYSFGGDRPSQTTHQTLSRIRLTDLG